MDDKKSTSIINLIPALLNIFFNLSRLVKNDFQQFGRSLYVCIILTILLTMALMTGWICLLAMLFTYLMLLHVNIILNLFVIFLLNALLFIIILLILFIQKNKLSFPHVRHLFRN